MKDNLVGRVIGHTAPRALHPSQVEAGEPLTAEITCWSRVTDEHRNDPSLVIVRNIHTGVHGLVRTNAIHSIMPESY